MPKLLRVEQKQFCVEVSQDMLDSTNSDPNFMNTIISGDESWVYKYDAEAKSDESTKHYFTQMFFTLAKQVRCSQNI